MSWLAVAALVLAAVVVGWPGARRRVRRRVRAAGGLPDPAVNRWRADLPALARRWLTRLRPPGTPPGTRPTRPGRRHAMTWQPVAALAGLAGVLAGGLGGPVAAVAIAAYTATAAVGWRRHHRARAGAARRAYLLDLLGGAAADLRAGLPASAAFAELAAAGDEDPLWSRVRAAVALAERTGAPLAAVIERVEADARSADRAAVAAGAQVAGARATTVLLAALPLAGIGLGYAIGADPLAVLLHTPVGAAAGLTAVGLQLAGLGWATRITRPAAVRP